VKTLVKAFKTINNSAGGLNGAKKTKNTKKNKKFYTLLEDMGTLTVLSSGGYYDVVSIKKRSKMSLRKNNQTAWLSDNQIKNLHYRKKRSCILISNKDLFKSTEQRAGNKRLFIKFT